MSPSPQLSLLRDARNLLAALPSWRLDSVHRRSRDDLLIRIEHLLDRNEVAEAPAALVHDLRARWRAQADIKIDSHPIIRRDGDVIWVSAWLLGRADQSPFDAERFIIALAELPLMAREVYRLHRVQGRSLGEVARELGIATAEVETQLALALCGLHERLFGQS